MMPDGISTLALEAPDWGSNRIVIELILNIRKISEREEMLTSFAKIPVVEVLRAPRAVMREAELTAVV